MDLSIIIITWNSKHFLQKCLNSIYSKNQKINFELIIIDNNSHDGTDIFIRENYPDAIYIKNTDNKGVAPARNQGLKIVTGKYILILDVDTELITENGFDTMLDYMDSNSDVGLLGAQLIFPDGEVQFSCLRFPSVWVKLFNRIEWLSFIRNSKMLQQYYMTNINHREILEVDYVIGAFQLIRKQSLDLVGSYDDNIFYGPEDIDYCLRLKKSGYRIIYFPKVVLYHFYQRITKKFFTKITYLHIKGLFYFFWKHKYINYPKY